MKKAKEIIEQMIEEMPFNMQSAIKPYIKEAMEIYAIHEIKKHLEIAASLCKIKSDGVAITNIEIKLT